MFEFDLFSLFLALTGVVIGLMLLVNMIVASNKLNVHCAEV